MRLESCPPPSVGGAAASHAIQMGPMPPEFSGIRSVGRHLASRSQRGGFPPRKNEKSGLGLPS